LPNTYLFKHTRLSQICQSPLLTQCV
jgi:hypothetical protein